MNRAILMTIWKFALTVSCVLFLLVHFAAPVSAKQTVRSTAAEAVAEYITDRGEIESEWDVGVGDLLYVGVFLLIVFSIFMASNSIIKGSEPK